MTSISFSNSGLALPPTPLRPCPALARTAGVAQVLVKDESLRPFGNFKILGGMIAGLKALARAAGTDLDGLRAPGRAPLPRLVCASDGNHGLAVAAAARAAGAPATIHLHHGVDRRRSARIAALGAMIAWVNGTYDDAVDAARLAAADPDCLLIPDTSSDPDDPVVADVMAGYALLCDELAVQLAAARARPSHVFVQAGVGGLAAALATGLAAMPFPDPALVVVEPEQAACVGPALATGSIRRIAGDLETMAEMLSCGEASAPALARLRDYGARHSTVSEAELADAATSLERLAGIASTPSGAAGWAALATARAAGTVDQLTEDSVVLLMVTEGRLAD